MREPDYRGLAALIIAVCAAVGIFIVLPIAIIMGMTLGEFGSQVVVALGGALVGAFSVYMGMRNDREGPKP
jgi:hypothetical protein